MRARAGHWLSILSIAVAFNSFSALSYGAGSDAFYQRLGVPPTASDEEIKKAYQKLAMKYHPDRLSGRSAEEQAKAENEFKEIKEAYEKLSGGKNGRVSGAATLEQVFQDLESTDKEKVLRGLDLVTQKSAEIEHLDLDAHNNHQGVRLIDAYDKIIQELGPSSGEGGLVVQNGVEDFKVFEALVRSVMRTFFVWDTNPFTNSFEILWPNSHMADVDPFPAWSYIEKAVESGIKRGWKLEEICKVLQANNASLRERFPTESLEAWVSVNKPQNRNEFDHAVQLFQQTWKQSPPELSVLNEIAAGRSVSKKPSQASEKKSATGFFQCLTRGFRKAR